MRVLIVGAGKIGAGYLAPLFDRAGWHVTFAARSSEGAARMRRVAAYSVTEVPAPRHPDGTGQPAARRGTVSGFSAVAVGTDGFRRALGAADLVCTAVGVSNVASLGPAVADALHHRGPDRPLDIWVVENADCAAELAGAVSRAAGGRIEQPPAVGFAGAVATVAVGRGSWEDPHPEFVGDDARRLLVDASRLVTRPPALAGVAATSTYPADLRAKLHVFNAGHAICAYLGWLRGHATVEEAVADPLLRPIVAGAMLESQRAVLDAHPVLGDDAHTPVATALRRFANRRLADPIPRVARDPIRKLGPHDRLVGPMLAVADATGRIPAHFALGVAGALLFRHECDAQADTLHHRLADDGVVATLAGTAGIPPGSPLSAAIADRYRGFIFADDEVLFPPAYTDQRERETVTA